MGLDLGGANVFKVRCKNHIIFDASKFDKCQLSEMELHTNSILFPI